MHAGRRSDPDLSGGVAVVTGASAGIGRATARRLARAGAAVGLVARDAAALEQVKQEIESRGGRALVAAADVADPDAVFAAAQAVEDTLGPIETWVNDAMVTVFAPLSETTPAEFRRVTEVTYLGYVHGTMAALRHMRPRNRGTIVQVGSSLAYRGIPLQAAYCGAKHAIRGFTDSLRCELLHENCRVALTMVQLPAVNTPQFDWARSRLDHPPRPVAPVVQPEWAADAILTAIGNPRREYWLGLSTAKVILGNIVAPGLLDRYLARRAIAGQQRSGIPASAHADNLQDTVHPLHSTRGNFSDEASADGVVLTSHGVRTALACAGGLIVLAALLAGRSLAQRPK